NWYRGYWKNWVSYIIISLLNSNPHPVLDSRLRRGLGLMTAFTSLEPWGGWSSMSANEGLQAPSIGSRELSVWMEARPGPHRARPVLTHAGEASAIYSPQRR